MKRYLAGTLVLLCCGCGLYDSGGPLGRKDPGPPPDYSEESVFDFPASDDGCATFRASIISDGEGDFAAVGIIENDCEIDAAFDFLQTAGAPRDDEEYDTTDIRNKRIEFEAPAIEIADGNRRLNGHFMACDLAEGKLEFDYVRRVHLRPGEWLEMRGELPQRVTPSCPEGSCDHLIGERVFLYAFWPIPHRSTDPIDRRIGYDPESPCEHVVRGGDPAQAPGVGKTTVAVVSTRDTELGNLVRQLEQ